MTVEQNVAQHYSHGSLGESIFAALAKAGIVTERIDADDLAPVDEFHTGGRQATMDFAEQLAFPAGAHLLDVGSGLGGPARFFAKHRGCRVSGQAVRAPSAGDFFGFYSRRNSVYSLCRLSPQVSA